MKLGRLVILFLLFISIFFCKTNAQTSVGKKMPAFSFFTMERQRFTNKDIAGKGKTIFIFYSTTCDHCQSEISAIGSRYAEFGNTSFYLITIDAPSSVYQFMSTYGKQLYGKKNVTLLRDPWGSFITSFGLKEYPALFIYGPNQQLINFFNRGHPLNEIIRTIKRPV